MLSCEVAVDVHHDRSLQLRHLAIEYGEQDRHRKHVRKVSVSSIVLPCSRRPLSLPLPLLPLPPLRYCV
jgi:hypothetical protein